MIDFRYHLVSLVAVFLALAIGVVLGAGPLNGTISSTIDKQTSALRSERRDLQETVRTQGGRISYGENAAALIEPDVLEGRLLGHRVVLVAAPGADSRLVDQLEKAVGESGATISGTVTLQKNFLDTTKVSLLGETVRRSAPSGVKLPAGGSFAQAGAALAAALLTTDTEAGEATQLTTAALFSALTDAEFISTTGTPADRADLALVVTGTDASGKNQVSAKDALLPLVTALDAGGNGAVVASPDGTAGTSGTLIAELRSDGSASDDVSSDDLADKASGRIGTVLALVEQTQGGSGQYGDGKGAGAAVPSIDATGSDGDDG